MANYNVSFWWSDFHAEFNTWEQVKAYVKTLLDQGQDPSSITVTGKDYDVSDEKVYSGLTDEELEEIAEILK